MTSYYLPELDRTPELEHDDLQLYQDLIEMLRCSTQFGRVDILHKVSLLLNIKLAHERDTYNKFYTYLNL